MKATLVESRHACKEVEGGGGSGTNTRTRYWLHKEEDETKETKPAHELQNHLELRLGISLTSSHRSEVMMQNDTKSSCEPKAATPSSNPSGARLVTSLDLGLMLNGLMPSPSTTTTTTSVAAGIKRWFAAVSEPGSSTAGFIHPWSLAARQQKAVFEQAHQRSRAAATTPAALRFTAPAAPPPPIVGWPPVSATRRNFMASSPTKPETDDNQRDAKKAKMIAEVDGEKEKSSVPDEAKPAAMFVKVNMEGFAVGRKINLKAHHSYESLSRALQKMFANFLSANYSCNSAQDEEHEDDNSDYILLYEDHEGDRMLVGDVPWELFITSAKRLYIALSPKTPKSEDEKATDAEK